MTRLRCRIALTILLGALGGCTDTGPDIQPGLLVASLASPNGLEGAALIHIVGAGVGSLEPTGDGRAFTSSHGDTLRVLLVLDTPGELGFRISVPDLATPPTATVLQVADGANALRLDISAYQVRFSR